MKNVILTLFFLLTIYSTTTYTQIVESIRFFCCSPQGFCSDLGFDTMTTCQAACEDFSRCQAHTVRSYTNTMPELNNTMPIEPLGSQMLLAPMTPAAARVQSFLPRPTVNLGIGTTPAAQVLTGNTANMGNTTNNFMPY
jgi:hypothetical protein